MPQYDVHPALDGDGFLVDVQSDLIGDLATRVVVPLMPEHSGPTPARWLNPTFLIGGQRYVLMVQFLSGVRRSSLRPPVESLAPQSEEITRALDMLLHGV